MGNQKGSALLIVIIALAVLMILGVIVLNISASEAKFVSVQENEMKVHYTARSGAEAMASYVIKHPDEVEALIADTADPTKRYTGAVNGKTFEVQVIGAIDPDTNRITQPIIISKAFDMVGGVLTEKDKVELQLEELNLFDHAIFAKDDLSMGNNEVISGDIGTNASSIDFGANPHPGDVVGNITLGVGATPADIADAEAVADGYNVDKLTTEVVFPPIDTDLFAGADEFPADGVLDNTGITYWTIDELNSALTLSGSGEVHLFVTTDITFNGADSSIMDGTVKLYIYFNETDDVTLNGSADFHYALYAPFAKVLMNGGGGDTFTGSIICNEYQGANSGVNIVHDPDLDMSHLAVTSGSGYKRAVYSD